MTQVDIGKKNVVLCTSVWRIRVQKLMLQTWKWSYVFHAVMQLQVSDSNTGLWNVWTNASEWWLHTFLLLLPLVFTGLQTWWV